MKSDIELYKIFSTEPTFLFELIGAPYQGNYSFKSVVIKEFSREMDGLLEPDDPKQPHFVVEFQNQKEESIYERTILEMASLSRANSQKTFYGIIIFGDASYDPKREPWASFTQVDGGKFQVFYLLDLLKKLSKATPDHPIIAIFYPFVEEDLEKLEKNAVKFYNQIINSQLQKQSKEKYIEVFIEWLTARFIQKSKKEILSMLPQIAPFKETQFYKDIHSEGEIEGEIKGEIKGKLEKIQFLKELNEQGNINDELYKRHTANLKKEVNVLKKKLKDIQINGSVFWP